MTKPLPSLEETVQIFGLRTKKSLGQHFLLDDYLCEQIAALAGDLSDTHVIEIGPGPGGLTRALLTSAASHITAIEKDERAIPALEILLPHAQGRLSILPEDALEIDAAQIGQAPRAIIANLPYNIGTELVMRWLDDVYRDPNCYRQIVVMLQREVGTRFAAEPHSKAYGRLSVMAQWLCDVEIRMDVPKECFSPPPKVESVMLQLTPLAKPRYDIPKAALEKVVNVAFQQRRKMLRSALKSLNLDLAALGIDDTLRPDQLTLEQFATLAGAMR